MRRVGRFSKVSFEQFEKEMLKLGYDHDQAKVSYDCIKLPERSTCGSAGYDFYNPVDLVIRPGETAKIPTGVRVSISDGWMLAMFPRSGLGCKYRMQLDNTVGIVDSDYYYSSNEGHIFASVTNDSKSEKTLEIRVGDRFMQGVFLPFGVTYDDNVTKIRDGGFGSTGV